MISTDGHPLSFRLHIISRAHVFDGELHASYATEGAREF